MPKNAWIEEVYRLMDSRAYGSTELVAALKDMPRYRRYTPSPQEVVNVMRGDARFHFIGTMTVGSLLRSRSNAGGTASSLHRATIHVSLPKQDPQSATIRVCAACITNILDYPQ